tara:strand:- start:400 stop:537 length:138 start_codon:yes stop_codon:yes gene_type:complete
MTVYLSFCLALMLGGSSAQLIMIIVFDCGENKAQLPGDISHSETP